MHLVLVLYIGATFQQKFEDVQVIIFGRNHQGSIAVLSRGVKVRVQCKVHARALKA